MATTCPLSLAALPFVISHKCKRSCQWCDQSLQSGAVHSGAFSLLETKNATMPYQHARVTSEKPRSFLDFCVCLSHGRKSPDVSVTVRNTLTVLVQAHNVAVICSKSGSNLSLRYNVFVSVRICHWGFVPSLCLVAMLLFIVTMLVFVCLLCHRRWEKNEPSLGKSRWWLQHESDL